MQYIIETFNSVAGLINTMQGRKLVQGMEESSQRTGNGSWAGTDSYKEASDLALYGDKNSMLKVQDSCKRLKKDKARTEQRSQARIIRTVAGTRPCVPAAIMGRPNSMYRRMNISVKKPVVTVFYSMSASGGESTASIINTGANLAEAIQIAERSGVRVNLSAGVTAATSKQHSALFVRIKDSSKDFDLLRMAYVLINPSFLRRHYFRWIETKEGIDPDLWKYGYGKPMERDELKKLTEQMQKQAIKADYLLAYNDIKSKSSEQIARIITGQDK